MWVVLYGQFMVGFLLILRSCRRLWCFLRVTLYNIYYVTSTGAQKRLAMLHQQLHQSYLLQQIKGSTLNLPQPSFCTAKRA